MENEVLALLILLAIAGVLLVHKFFVKGETITIVQTGTNKIMAVLEREQKLLSDLADIIEAGVAQKMTDGEWTKEEGKAWKTRMANLFEIKDLLPKGQKTLKEMLLKRAEARLTNTEAGTSAPAPPKKKSLSLVFK